MVTTPSYPRYVQPPPMWAVQEWTGSNSQAVQDFLDAHGITATVVVAGAALYLLMGSSSPSYASGASIVLRCDDGESWSVDSTRSSSAGLAPYADYYVS
jgi:hypothetical protein